MAISLKIKGNKRTNEGIGNDLVSIGDNRFPVTDAQYPGTNGATDFIVMRHLPDKSIYTIVSKNVTPCDSNREGTLYISVCVPAKEQVEGLFNMLIELQNAYKSTCMTYDGTMYHFLARNDMPQPFEEIISRRHTVRYPYKTISTSSELSKIAYLFMTPEQISDLLTDPMRGEFGHYGEIVLIPVSDPTQYVSTMNIPSKIWRSYKITVNGRPTGQTLADPTKTVTITLPETKTHESVSTTFSLQQARETHMTGIKVDDEEQVIYLNMQPKLKQIPKPIVIPVPPQEPPATGIVKHKKLIYAIAAVALAVIVGVAVYMLFLAPANTVNDKSKNKDAEVIEAGADDQEKGSGNSEESNGTGKTNKGDNSGGVEQEDGVIEGEIVESEEDKAARQAEEREKEKQKLLKQYNDCKNAIETGRNLSFEKFKNIYKHRTNYTEFGGYQEFEKQVEFVNNVVNYIKSLNGEVKSEDYRKKIFEFEKEAESLKLEWLKEKLHKRIKRPSDITESKTNNRTF